MRRIHSLEQTEDGCSHKEDHSDINIVLLAPRGDFQRLWSQESSWLVNCRCFSISPATVKAEIFILFV